MKKPPRDKSSEAERNVESFEAGDLFLTTEPDSSTQPSSHSSAKPANPGNRNAIGRYTVIGKLGSGGQADVYRAVHPTLPIEVAIKLTHYQVDDRIRETLKQEAYLLCDLDHPNIARVRDFDFDAGRPFMVLDLVRGQSLAQVAQTKPFSPKEAAAMVSKLAKAMQHAHSRGVIHRDLKADNVVIDEQGEPKIIDFGLSRIRTAMSGDEVPRSEISGTLAYMASEQAIGDSSKIDHRVDVFALGAILYRLLVGSPPYPAGSVSQLLPLVREGKWNREALGAVDAPEELKDICCRAMATDASDRYPDAVSLAEALYDCSAAPSTQPAITSSFALPGCLVTLTVAMAMLVMVGIRVADWRRSDSVSADVTFGTDGFRPPSTQIQSNPSSTPYSTYGHDSAPNRPRDLPVDDRSLVAPIKTRSLIKSFDILHIGNSTERAEFSGPLMQYRAPRVNDDIQVRAEFAVPVYCFLVALNPDGVKQLCYPADADVAQNKPITTLRYPELENAAFGLTDGAGQQAFVLFTSKAPLPAYNHWNEELVAAEWPSPEMTGNWQYEQGELIAITAPKPDTRGVVRETKTPTPFKELCDRLRKQGSSDARGVLFEVESAR